MPSDWARSTLGHVAEIDMGQSPPGDSYNHEGVGIPLLNGPTEFGEMSARVPMSHWVSVVRRTIQPSSDPTQFFEHYSLPAFDNGRAAVVEAGARMLSSKVALDGGEVVLLSKLNPATKRIWWPRPSGMFPAVCSSEFLVLASHRYVPTSFVYCSLRSDLFLYEEILSHVTGTTGSRQRVKPADVLDCKMFHPEVEEIRRFDRVARPILDLAAKLNEERGRLTLLRDLLLPKLVFGQIRVPETYDPDGALGELTEAAGAAA